MPDPKNKEQTDNTPAAETLQKSLQEKTQLIEKQAQILQHPTIKAALTLLAQGKEVEVGPKGSTPLPEKKSASEVLGRKKTSDEAVDLNELDNVQLVDNIAEGMEQYVKQATKEVAGQYEEHIRGLTGELQETKQALMKLSAQKQVEDVSKQYPDFDKYRDQMQDKIKEYPNLSLLDTYKLVKAEDLMKHPARQNTESEKPESSTTFPQWEPIQHRTPEGNVAESKGQSNPTPLRMVGTRSFRSLVEQAASRRTGNT